MTRATRALVVIAAAAVVMAGAAVADLQPWKRPASPPAAARPAAPVADVAGWRCLDGRYCWIAVPDRQSSRVAVFATADGGLTWSAIPAPDFGERGLAAIQLLDRRDAVLAGFRGLAVTGDSGLTWSRRPLPPGAISGQGVSFLDPLHAWYLDPGLSPNDLSDPFGIWSTADGARTWTRLAAAGLPGRGRRTQLVFATPTAGWITVESRSADKLYRTSDGGGSWSPVDLPAGAVPVGGVQVRGSDELVVADVGDRWLAFAARSGSAWAPAGPVPAAALVQGAIGPQLIGRDRWLVLGGGELWQTSDGGLRWAAVDLPVGFRAQQLWFADAAAGWALAGGRLLRTADGGRTWTALRLPAG